MFKNEVYEFNDTIAYGISLKCMLGFIVMYFSFIGDHYYFAFPHFVFSP